MQSSAIKGSKCAENPDGRPGPGKGKSMQKLLTWRNGRRSRHRCEFITRKQATIPTSQQSPTKCSNISKCRRFKCFLAGFHMYSPFLAIFIDFLVFTTSEFHYLNSCNCCVCFHFSSFPFLWFDIRLSCADSVKWEEINNSGRYFCTVLSPPRIINFHFVFI